MSDRLNAVVDVLLQVGAVCEYLGVQKKAVIQNTQINPFPLYAFRYRSLQVMAGYSKLLFHDGAVFVGSDLVEFTTAGVSAVECRRRNGPESRVGQNVGWGIIFVRRVHLHSCGDHNPGTCCTRTRTADSVCRHAIVAHWVADTDAFANEAIQVPRETVMSTKFTAWHRLMLSRTSIGC